MPRIAVGVGTENSALPRLAAGEGSAASGVGHDDGDGELVAVGVDSAMTTVVVITRFENNQPSQLLGVASAIAYW